MKHATTPILAVLSVMLPAYAQTAPARGRAANPGNPEWNQWRGPKRDAISPDTGLLKQWPQGGPPLAWKTTGIGGGFSGVAFSKDRIFTMGDLPDTCAIVALDMASGRKLWTAPVGRTGGGGGYPGPRCTPATDGTLVFALGQHGDLVCALAATGRVVWRKNLASDFGGRMPGWGFSESPLLDGNLLVCTPGGSRGAVLAMNKAIGAPGWQSRGLTDAAAYASLVPIDLGGVRQYVVLTDASVAGIAAANGQVLWRAARAGRTAVVTTPVYHDGIVFVTSSYGVGHNAFRVAASGGRFQAVQIYSGTDMKNHHGGVILVGDHLYGMDEGTMKCMELRTGRVAWQDRSVGKGSIGCADGHFVVRSEGGAGTMALVEATPQGYREKGRFDQPDRSDKNSWPHPVIFGGKLYIRDQDILLCYDVKAK